MRCRLDRVVPSLLPESPEFQQMPLVLATGYMVGLFEWACIRGINPYLDWPREQSVGIGVNLSHVCRHPRPALPCASRESCCPARAKSWS